MARRLEYLLLIGITLQFLLPGASVCTAGSAVDPSSLDEITTATELDWSRNLGYLILDLENELFGDCISLGLDRSVTRADNYHLLTDLLARAEASLTLPREDPLETLLTIHRLLKSEGFRYQDNNSWEYSLLGYSLLHQGLARHELDCAMYVFLYMAIAERVGLPLAAVNLPGHMTLRWTAEDGDSFLWEATVPNRCDDEFYLDWKKPSATALRNGVYLAELSRQEIVASALYEKGLVLKERRQYQEALEVVESALSLAPRYCDARNLQGLLLSRLGDTTGAVDSFDEALRLDPEFSLACFNRARTRLAHGDLAGARRDQNLLAELDAELARRLDPLLGQAPELPE